MFVFLIRFPRLPRLVGLGEPTHGLEAFPRLRNRMFQFLVKEYGFRSVALESDILSGLRVGAYVQGQSDTLDEVMASGFTHGFGLYAANRELVQWLRELNAERPVEEQVRFYGFDVPMENMWAASPRLNLLALQDFLLGQLDGLEDRSELIRDLCGEDSRWTNTAAAMNPELSVGNMPAARELRVLADDLQTLLSRETPRLALSPDFWEAQLHARTALGLLRYHANMAQVSPGRLLTMLALRDLMMAENLWALAEREMECGPTLLFSHNLHLQRAVSGMTMSGQRMEQRMEWWSAGAHLSHWLGQDYAFIASGFGEAKALGIAELAPGTLEASLMQRPGNVSLLSKPELKSLTDLNLNVRSDFPPQAFPLKPSLLDEADGLLFVGAAEDSQ